MQRGRLYYGLLHDFCLATHLLHSVKRKTKRIKQT